MKKLVILSGKGGVGKSSITASLAIALSSKKKIICADCDVDASNLSLVFGNNLSEIYSENLSTNKKVKFNYDKCNNCGKCVETCYFNAIENNSKPKLKEFSCEGCGACILVCPQNAIEFIKINNAKIINQKTKFEFEIVSAQLGIGDSGSGKIVSEVKKIASRKKADLMVIDSAAGIGCPVIASVTGSDYALLVVEPTPSSLFDLKRAVKIVNNFKIPYDIIINKSDLNEKFSRKIKEEFNVISEFKFDKQFPNSLVNLKPLIEYDSKFTLQFEKLACIVIDKLFKI